MTRITKNTRSLRKLAVPLIGPLALLSGGCATSELGKSHYATSAEAKLGGVPYSLPRVLLKATLVRDADGISIEIGQPVYVADPKQTYLLRYSRHAGSKDKLNIGIDPQTSLLTSVGGEAEDQTAQVIVAVAKVAGGLGKMEGAVEPGAERQVFYQDVFDPANQQEITALNAAINSVLTTTVKNSIAGCAAGAKPEAAAKCPLRNGTPGGDISLDIKYEPFALATTPDDCGIGICTREPRPAVLSVKQAGVPVGAGLFNMPNGSAVVPIDLSRASFVKATHQITLQNGLVASRESSKESEALAIANIPLDILKGIFSAPTELIQLKVNYTNAQKDLLTAQKDKLDAEKARLEAEKQLVEAKNPDGTPKTESDIAGMPAAPGPPAAPAPPTLLMKVVLPGLGKGSGMELVAAAKEEGTAAGEKSNAASPVSPTTPVSKGSDGKGEKK